MTTQIAERELKTKFGTFTERMFANDVVALTKGSIQDVGDVPCRIHSSCLSGHAFSSTECQCLEEMEEAQRLIENAGRGVIIWLEQEGRGNGHLAVMKTQELKKKGMSQSAAYESLGYPSDARSFEQAAATLKCLGVKSIRLLSSSPKKADDLRNLGIVISGLIDRTAAQSALSKI